MKKRGDLQAADESVLIDAAIQRDIEAFGYLHERYRSDLYAICLRRLNDPSLAEDAVQDSFIRGFTSIPNFDPKRPFWPWLVAVAFRACIDIQRRRSLTHYSGDIEVSVEAGANGHTESALDEVIASEERAEFWKSLDVLPERQRRVFLSYTLDGLSCADVAAAEGISLGAVHMLLLRARKKMRAARQSGPLPAIVLPFTWLRWKVQRIEERIRPLLSVYSEGLSGACAQVVCLGTLAVVVVAAILPTTPLYGNDVVPPNETVLLSTQLSSPLQAASLPDALSEAGASTKTSVEPQQSVVEATGSLVDDVVNYPSESATPETTLFSSVMASPDYESDHTILAAGYCGMCLGNVLFVSNDGGANWKPSSSLLLFGSNMVLSPAYSQDRRVFVLGDLGLQQSDNGGAIFRTVSTLVGRSLAISPTLRGGDSKVLIGGKTVAEYDTGTGVTRPGSLVIPPSSGGSYPSIAVSSGYPPDSTIFVSDWAKDALGMARYDQSLLYRCRGSICDEMQFPVREPLTLRLSPNFDHDGLAYAFAGSALLFSNDGVRTFRDIEFPLPYSGSIRDVAVLWDGSLDPPVFVSVDGLAPGVYRSFDTGRSWNMTSIDLPGFNYGGAQKLITTPTGRLLAAGRNGIACSEDNGQTWAPRCPPEK